jgi:hypothetical protein
MAGFPSLMKEATEILECGKLSENNFRAIEYVKCIEKYCSIE